MRRQGGRPDRGATWSRYGVLEYAFWLPVIFLLFLVIGALMRHLPVAMPLIYLGVSGLSVWLYARDKGKAQRAEWRTPESFLHAFDLAGGWPGGLIAQRVFRHKTRKASFQVIFWLSTLLHLGIWAWIFVSVPAETDLLRFATRVARTAVADLSR